MPKVRLPTSIAWGILVLGLLPAAPAEAQHRVDVGDVIEIVVARVPELQRRTTVKVDGSISFPLLGSLAVAGLSPSQLEAKIQATLASKVFQRRSADGRESEVLIDRDEVTATVVEYRPIYVSGDVARPGEHGYRLFMTARQAIALSGGYDLMRARMSNNPLFELADLRTEHESLLTELAREQARVWRLKSELGYQDNIDQNTLMDVPIARPVLAQIVSVEAEHLKVRQADHRRQKAFLQLAVKTGDQQIGVLSEQQHKEEQGVKADNDELQSARALRQRGPAQSSRDGRPSRLVVVINSQAADHRAVDARQTTTGRSRETNGKSRRPAQHRLASGIAGCGRKAHLCQGEAAGRQGEASIRGRQVAAHWRAAQQARDQHH
jgi:polysaccharide biosynthesis/export protein